MEKKAFTGNAGDRVECYANLHNGLISLRGKHSNNRVQHVEEIILENVTFSVQPAGREKVLREGRKNVHAFVRGIVSTNDSDDQICYYATYNPYRSNSFMSKSSGMPVRTSRRMRLKALGNGKFEMKCYVV